MLVQYHTSDKVTMLSLQLDYCFKAKNKCIYFRNKVKEPMQCCVILSLWVPISMTCSIVGYANCRRIYRHLRLVISNVLLSNSH